MLVGGKKVSDFDLEDRLLCYIVYLCVPWRKYSKLIWEAHYSQVTEHFNVEKIVAVLQKYFDWPKIRHDVGKYIRTYTTCAIATPTIKKKGLYTPLPITKHPWEFISMDYLSSLPSTKHGNGCVFVVMDKFFKMIILVTCKKNITTKDTSKLFF